MTASTDEDSGGAAETTHYQYDNAGQLTRVVALDGSAMEYTYDAAHRLTDLRNGVGNTVHFTLDNMGNVTHQEVRGAAGDLVTTAQRAFDALNRLQKEQRDGQDAGTSYSYDRNGNLTSVTDPLGRITSHVFDSFDRVLAQTLPAATPGTAAPVIGYSYSHQDQLLSVTDPRKLTTRYTVDGFGQHKRHQSRHRHHDQPVRWRRQPQFQHRCDGTQDHLPVRCGAPRDASWQQYIRVWPGR